MSITNLPTKNMARETATPARIIKIHTLADRGERNEKRLTAFSGALTNKTLMPEEKKLD